ncbi:hypothetical protein [Solemya elarraichensis gill symbiont]|uniref:Uncharacterized protein n=1 Tax=Solemya elarraichensis gill symbiont TaxID=1918949 RepID=A0A1T2KZ12_9GAMM|nr:hypothetical protein [Solemya elarraichensis gill symbiont]OOZ38024.1 hypothetical protein BOW52_09590 [Solemya elarraichensis gill symbiont]
MKRDILFIPILTISLILMIFNAARAENNGVFKNGITQATMRTAIDSSGGYLARQIRDDGSFIYHANIITAIPLKPYYNWVRHAVAIVVLEDYYQLTRKQKLVPLLRKSIERMRVDSIGSVEGVPNATAVWDDAQSNAVEGDRFAILGGAGLGLLALCKFTEIEPNAVPVSELESLGNFILAMQKPSGDLFPTWIPEKGGRTDEWASPYNAG